MTCVCPYCSAQPYGTFFVVGGGSVELARRGQAVALRGRAVARGVPGRHAQEGRHGLFAAARALRVRNRLHAEAAAHDALAVHVADVGRVHDGVRRGHAEARREQVHEVILLELVAVADHALAQHVLDAGHGPLHARARAERRRRVPTVREEEE